MQLVDEEHDAALGGLDLREERLEPILELPAVLRAGDHRTDVEREHALVLETLRHVAGRDAQRDPLGDRGLADAGLPDQDGVVLGPSGEHVEGASDLVVATDHRIELADPRELGEVARIAPERVVLGLRFVVGDAVGAADLFEARQDGFVGDAVAGERTAGIATTLDEGEEDVLGRDVGVLHLVRLLLSAGEELLDLVGIGEVRVAGDGRQLAESRLQVGLDRGQRGPEAAEESRYDPVLLPQDGGEQVQAGDLWVSALEGHRLGIDDCLARLHGQLLVSDHGRSRGGIVRPVSHAGRWRRSVGVTEPGGRSS